MDTQQKKPGFHSIRNRILLFSILVTLVPSCGMGWFWFDLSRKATTEKTEQKLIDSAGIVEREISLWFKERNYDLRVFANSFVILDNLRRYNAEGGILDPSSAAKHQVHLANIAKYLTLIQKQFPLYRRLVLLDRNGKMLATSDSPDPDRALVFSADWQTRIDASRYFTGEVSFIGKEATPLMPVGVSLFSGGKEAHLGFLVMEVELDELLPLLRASLPRAYGAGAGRIVLFTADGRPFLAANPPDIRGRQHIAPPQVGKMLATPRRLQAFVDEEETRLVGLASPFSNLPWNLVIAENADEVFAGLNQARDRIVLITLLLTIAIGGTATIVASQIIIPLQALTDGVMQVGRGDLEVTVPILRDDELGLVSGMFNEMVSRLKENQAKLELMATTDSLTGLANRKQIMADLAAHLEHHRRYGTDFSLLMIDIDYFKRINDSHGHLVGDAVLVQLAQVFQEILHSLDSAGRYGGEEFLIILGQIDNRQALQTAERIRQVVDQHVFVCGDISLHATVSIGVAGTLVEEGSSSGMIDRADKALYEAKAGGRNRVVQRC